MKHGKPQDSQSEAGSLEEQALSYLEKSGATSVQELHNVLRVRNPSLTQARVADLVWRLSEQGKTELEDVPPVIKSATEYLRLRQGNLWLYASLAISFATVLLIYAVPADYPFVALRLVLGSVLVLFIPGYMTVKALFPQGRELGSIERFALSVGLSLALLPLVGLLLNYTPWGISLTPIVISLTILTIGFAAIAAARQYRTSVQRNET